MQHKVLISQESVAVNAMLSNVLTSNFQNVNIEIEKYSTNLDNAIARFMPDLIIYSKKRAETILNFSTQVQTPVLVLLEENQSKAIDDILDSYNVIGILRKPFEYQNLNQQLSKVLISSPVERPSELQPFLAVNKEIIDLFNTNNSEISSPVDPLFSEIEDQVDNLKALSENTQKEDYEIENNSATQNNLPAKSQIVNDEIVPDSNTTYLPEEQEIENTVAVSPLFDNIISNITNEKYDLEDDFLADDYIKKIPSETNTNQEYKSEKLADNFEQSKASNLDAYSNNDVEVASLAENNNNQEIATSLLDKSFDSDNDYKQETHANPVILEVDTPLEKSEQSDDTLDNTKKNDEGDYPKEKLNLEEPESSKAVPDIETVKNEYNQSAPSKKLEEINLNSSFTEAKKDESLKAIDTSNTDIESESYISDVKNKVATEAKAVKNQLDKTFAIETENNFSSSSEEQTTVEKESLLENSTEQFEKEFEFFKNNRSEITDLTNFNPENMAISQQDLVNLSCNISNTDDKNENTLSETLNKKDITTKLKEMFKTDPKFNNISFNKTDK